MGEEVIGIETVELVPGVIDAGDRRLVRTGQPAAKLQIILVIGFPC